MNNTKNNALLFRTNRSARFGDNAHIEDEIYVTDDVHPRFGQPRRGHARWQCGQCCLHCAAFDVRTGEVKSPPTSFRLLTYEVLLQGDDVYIDLDKSAAGEPA